MLPGLRQRVRRHPIRWTAGALLLCFLALLGWEVLRIRNDLDAGRRILGDLDLLTVEDEGGLSVVVGQAVRHIESADRTARTGLALRVLGSIPGISGQIDGIRSLTGAVAEIGRAGQHAADRIQGELDAGSGPASRLAVARIAAESLEELRSILADVDLGDGWLAPPLSGARAELAEELVEAEENLAEGAELVAALEGFLTGPRRYLILGGNNAEMRSGGIPTTSGLAVIEGGNIDVGDFSGATEDIELPEPGVPVPPDYEEMYGFLHGNRGYRTTTATANFPVAAEIMAEITANNRYGEVDGIIFVDTVTLQVLLGVVGPVEVDGIEYTFENLPIRMLYEPYLLYPRGGDSPERRQLQSDVSTAVFDALNDRDVPLTTLAGTLAALAHSRHLLAWSAHPGEQALWEALGADGSLERDTIGVVANQLNASKMDLFPYLQINVDSRPDHEALRHEVTLSVTIVNPQLALSSHYIDGGGYWAQPGEHAAYLVFYFPAGAENIEGSSPGFVNMAPDGPTTAGGMVVRTPEGEERTVTVSFTVPFRPDDTLSALPTARLYPTVWTIGGEEVIDNYPFDIRLTDHGAEAVYGEELEDEDD